MFQKCRCRPAAEARNHARAMTSVRVDWASQLIASTSTFATLIAALAAASFCARVVLSAFPTIARHAYQFTVVARELGAHELVGIALVGSLDLAVVVVAVAAIAVDISQVSPRCTGPNRGPQSRRRCVFFPQASRGERMRCKGRWRRERDSNPRYGFPYTRFPSVRLQPLGHPSNSVLAHAFLHEDARETRYCAASRRKIRAGGGTIARGPGRTTRPYSPILGPHGLANDMHIYALISYS
jgi:hypothetical protein